MKISNYFKSKSYGRRLFFLLMALILVSGLVFTPNPIPVLGMGGDGGPIDVDPIDPQEPPFQAPADGFTWEVPRRFGFNYNTDGVIDYHWDSASMTYDPNHIFPESWPARFIGCQTEADSEYAWSGTPNTYTWTIVDVSTTTVNQCIITLNFPAQGTYTVRMEVRDPSGNIVPDGRDPAYFEQMITIKDYFIVSIGDSVASGEGNPDYDMWATPNTPLPGWTERRPAVWQDKRCHRSAKTGAAMAALALEGADPHTSVTFISFACSGATINTPLFENSDPAKHLGTGILGPYRGADTDVPFSAAYVGYIPAQMDQLRTALATRPAGRPERQIDALIISAGGNDIHFGDIATKCVADGACWTNSRVKEDPHSNTEYGLYELVARALKTNFVNGNPDNSPTNVPDGFDILAGQINGLSPAPPANVYLTQYMDQTRNDSGGYCKMLDDIYGWLDKAIEPSEAQVASQFATRGLNDVLLTVAQKYQSNNWQFVDGISSYEVDPLKEPHSPGQFVLGPDGKGHGYCASYNWIRRADESEIIQGPVNARQSTRGTLHPNYRGHEVYKERILRYMLPDLLDETQEATPTFSFSFSSAGLTSQPGANGWYIQSCDSQEVCFPKFVAQAVAVSNTAMNGASILVNDTRGCNGSSVICSITPSPDAKQLTYAVEINASGMYRFQFNAQDSNGRVSFLQQEFKVDLENPVLATPIGPFEVQEGDSVLLVASASSPGENAFNYDWDLENDGIFETTDEQPTFSATNLDGPVSKTIQVKVTDRAGRTDTGQATVDVLNTVPAIVYDNFDDNVTDSSLWSVEQVGGPTVSEVNQRLEITLPVNSTGSEFKAWYLSTCQLRGDYDIQVDYEVLTWPDANGVRIGLADDHANMQRISSRGQPYDISGGPDLYLTTFDTASHIVGITPTSDHSGKLKLERVGDTLNSYYFASGAWTLDASYSDPAYTQDTYFYIGSFSGTPAFAGQEVKIAFDNMMIDAGELVCPQTPAPDLAITQVADHATVSTGDPVGFTITTTNNGDATANTVTVSDTLPTAAELAWSVSGTDAASCTITAGVVSCNFGDMSPGAMKSIRLTSPTRYIVGDGFCPVIGSTATVMATNEPVNRSATASTTVLCPSAYIEMLADNQDSQSIPAGDPVSFTTKFGNMGDGIARDVLAEIVLPTNPGLNWSIKSSIPAEAANNCVFGTDYIGNYELICSFDQMTTGQEVTVTLTSPTTSASCGAVNSSGYMSLSNGMWVRFIMKPPIITCPVGDTTPPVITPYISGMFGTNGWFTTDILLIWSVTDPQSAIISTSGCEAVSITQDEAATDYTCTATSEGGMNSASVTIKRDDTKPVTSVINVTEGATYILGSVPQAGCSSTDNLSGIAAEATLVLSGGDAQGVGNITATCSGALDGAGNAADPAVVHYTVSAPSNTYNFTGFFQPVDNWPTENTLKAGVSVPIRFTLDGDMGLAILAAGSPTSRQVTCPSSSAVTADAIEETTTSNSGLTYDTASGQYVYVWKTNKTWANTCRAFTILFADGSSQQALFKFSK